MKAYRIRYAVIFFILLLTEILIGAFLDGGFIRDSAVIYLFFQ